MRSAYVFAFFVFSNLAVAQAPPPATRPILELQLRTQLKGHAVAIKALATSSDGKTIASGDTSGIVMLWDRATAKEVRKITGPENVAVISLSFSKDGKQLATGLADGRVRILEIPSGEQVRELRVGSLTAARYSPDGSTLVCTRGMIAENEEDRANVQVYEAQTGKRIGAIEVDLEYVTDFSFSPYGRVLAISGGESLTDVPADKGGKQRNRIELWELAANLNNPDAIATENTRIGELGRPILSPVYSAGGRLIAGACGDWLVWETKSGNQLATLRAPQFQARCVAISPNVLWVATGAIDSTVALFNTRDWEMRFRHQSDPSFDVTAMCFTPEGGTLIAARGTTVDLFRVPGR